MAKRVAITGFSFRLPQTDINHFWQALLDGSDLVTEVDTERWAKDSFRHPKKNHPGSSYTFAAGSIGDISQFDPGFFGISPREAAQMDPQQRLLLEMSWEALENAGVKPAEIRGSQCGVFIGIASLDYSFQFVDDLAAIDASTATGNTSSIAANRLSYFFDLHGPSMAIDTACSSAMVAFHQACCSILSGESTQALTGGVSLHQHPFGFITFTKAAMLSPRGRCNVFDAAGDGYVRSEGGGVFFLKDYDQAIADGNPILAVVAGSAINTDGRKSGLTVPNPIRQSALLKESYRKAGIAVADIDYIEAHGTGTAIGDPIEMQAIGDALGKPRSKDTPLLIGSVKSNLGHLEAASGVAGLVKALYCLQHRMVPATIGIKNLNPKIEFDHWNLEVVSKNRPLKQIGKLVIGVNSFGFGGANAHVILESHEPYESRSVSHAALPILLSGKDQPALQAAISEFAAFLTQQPQSALYDIAYTTIFRREWHQQRTLVYGETPLAIAQTLQNFLADSATPFLVETGEALKAPSGPAFVYSGNGSQWQGMGKRLLAESAVFSKTVREIDGIFARYADFSIEDELAEKNGAGRFEYTEIAQPALFAFQVGVTQMLRQQGIMPTAVVGHSVGEVAAAWAASALTLEDAVKVIYYRSKLQGYTKGRGGMTAVALSADSAEQLLTELGLTVSLSIAGVNSPRGLTVAGNVTALACFESALNERKIFNKRLDLDYAFHSPSMEQIETAVREDLATLQPTTARLPFYSTVTGSRLLEEMLDADYWWRNIRQPVLFRQAIMAVLAETANIFIEIAPHPVLQTYLKDCAADSGTEVRIIPTIIRGDDEPQRITAACRQVVIAGIQFDWEGIFVEPGAVRQIPNYAWQRQSYWHPVTAESLGLLKRYKVHPLLGYPLAGHELAWENQLDTQLYPSLADHLVGEAVLFPGSGFAELALAAALLWQPGNLAELEALEIRAPLPLSDAQSKLVRLQINAADGSLTIKSRDFLGTDSWETHVKGRILLEANDILLRTQLPQLPARAPDFTGDSHLKLTHGVGLGYGPAFQGIAYGWVEDDAVIAVFKIPDSITAELAQTHLHPALLDCAFQLIFQLLKDELDIRLGVAFIPTYLGRVVFRADGGQPFLAKASLLKRSARTINAEFTIFNAAGAVIAVVKEVRFSRIRLRKNAVEHLCFLDYHSIPKPLALNENIAAVICFDSVHAAVTKLMQSQAMASCHSRFADEVEPLLDSLCCRFARQFLSLSTVEDGGFSLAEMSSVSIHPELEAFFSYLQHLVIDELSDATVLDDGISAMDIWNALLANYPDYFLMVSAVGRIGMQLPALVNGSVSLAGLRGGEQWSKAALLRQTLGSAVSRQAGQMLRELIQQGLSQLPEGRRLAVLEISEAEPLLAGIACIGIDFDCLDYVFVSSSDPATEDIAKLKERFPRLETQLLGATTQSARVGELYQLAIVVLDFDSIEQAIAALKYVRGRLSIDGSLLVIGQHPAFWLDFIQGGQAGYWSPLKNGGWVAQQRTAEFWLQQLQQLGFLRAELLEVSAQMRSGGYFLLAQGGEPVLRTEQSLLGKWLILASPNGGYSAQLSAKLCEKLQAKGALVILADVGDREAIESLLLAHGGDGQLQGIVHLAGLTFGEHDTAAERLLNQQIDRCAIAADIIQACEATHTDTTCWLITSGAVSELLPQPRLVKPTSIATMPGDAVLWGLGRTLINEASNYQVRLVDLEAPQLIEMVALALVGEFTQADAEQEIMVTAGGERYVPRLRQAPAGSLAKIEAETISLGFPFAGRLSNLRWESQSTKQRMPAADEVDVEVHATGLNFRDVMFVMGLISEEAVENGFAGPTLGLEFSGVVRQLGGKVAGFAIGDRVLGFGPACFANRVITKANAIAAIPAEMSMESAATIPCAFFTAYYALHHLARLQPGEKVLIHGAAGGVGIAAIQIAKWLGAEVFATAGSEAKRDFLKLLGVDNIFNSRTLAFADEILERTAGQGVDVILNSLSGEAINRNFRVLKPFGRFLELGKRDFYENTKIGLRPFRNNISYFGIDADQVMLAHPELSQRLFAELIALFATGVLYPLPYHLFAADDIQDAFRYMQQARQIGKIVVTYQGGIAQVYSKKSAPQQHLTLAADATYLVTGGLSGFGLKTAEWLVDKGARNLVLLGRSGVSSAQAEAVITGLMAQGVKIYAAGCDITDKTALATLLAETATALPPLKGIVHAAAVIQDGLINKMDVEQLRAVLAPKVLGAQYLHELTLDKPLDFFVFFSSATSLFGNPGQGSYVAANAFLNALASYRKTIGLAATSVCWGAIDDVGYLARNEKIKDVLQNRMGGKALNSAVALETLETLLLTGRSNLGVMELDWDLAARSLPSSASPKFSELPKHGAGGDGSAGSYIDLQQLLELPEAELLATLTEILRQELGEILRISVDKLDPQQAIQSFGLDSLMGFELIVAIETRFDIKLPVMLLNQYPTIAKLAEQIMHRLKGNNPVAGDDESTQDLAKQLVYQHGVDAAEEAVVNAADAVTAHGSVKFSR